MLRITQKWFIRTWTQKKAVKDNVRALNDDMGKRVENSNDIAKIFNKQFKSVFEVDNGLQSGMSNLKKEYDWGVMRA